MRSKFPLYAQIICVFVLNLALLIFVRFAFFSNQFKFGWESMINRSVGERVQTVAFLVFRQIEDLPRDKWTKVLNEYGEFYNVKFYLFDADGRQIAGDSVKLPDLVLSKIREAPFPIPIGRAENFLVDAPTDHRKPEETFQIVEEPQLFARFDKILSDHPPLPPPSRFFLRTSNPEMYFIGAMFPLHAIGPGGPRFLFKNDGSQHLEFHGLPPAPIAPPAVSGYPLVPVDPANRITFEKRSVGFGTLLAVTPNIWQTRLVSDFGNLFVVALGVLGLSLLVWWPFVFFITRTLGKLTHATEKIAEGNFDIRLNVKRPDEIGRLAQAVNIMTSRLKTYVTGQRRFLGDIAHELCSPIARLQIAIEILERSATPDQEDRIADIREEVDQMSALINELLAFSKAGVRETELHPVDLATIIDAAASKFGGGNIQISVPNEFYCIGDEVLLERAFGNILRNAIRYAGDAGPIRVTGERKGADAIVTVIDSGPGVPPETIELLGEPFYRPEAARTRTSGGVGLGLSIVKTCIEACNGQFSLQNNDPRGLKVEISLKFATAVCTEHAKS